MSELEEELVLHLEAYAKVSRWHDAVIRGDFEVVAQLLDEDLIDEVDSTGRNALHLAAINGHDGIVTQLLNFANELKSISSNICDVPDRIGWTALHCAASKGHGKAVAQLLAFGSAVNSIDHRGMTALHYATSEGHAHVVAELLADTRIDVEIKCKKSRTALHLAACDGHDGVVGQLLAHPRTTVDVGDEHGRTALHLAARSGYDKIVEQLLADSRTPINAVDVYGFTALRSAAKARREKVVSMLLAQESISIDRAEGLFVLRFAIAGGHDNFVGRLLSRCSMSDILAWMDDVDDEMTPFQQAVCEGHEAIAARLLKTVSPDLIEKLNAQGLNPLQLALLNDRDNLIDTLLAIRPDLITSISRTGDTILHIAACCRYNPQLFTKIWQLRSDDVSMINNFGDTPFSFAVLHANNFAIDLMQRKISFDEIVRTFAACGLDDAAAAVATTLEAECACLLDLMHQDVVGIVFDYCLNTSRTTRK